MRIGWNKKDNNPPEKEEYYLIQDGNRMHVRLWTNIHNLGYSSIGKWHWRLEPYEKVDAWMPLPEQYVDVDAFLEKKQIEYDAYDNISADIAITEIRNELNEMLR